MRSYRVIQSLRNVLFLSFILLNYSLIAQSPGGVNTNFKLWLKANSGVTGTSPIISWADQSGNGFNATAPGNAPILLTNQLNFNPVVDFTSASSQYMQITNGIMGASAYTNGWVYVVSKADIIQDQTLFYEGLAGSENFNVLAPWGNSNIYLDFGNMGGAGRINGAWGGSVNNYNIWTLGSGASAAATPNGTNKIISRDGSVILSNNNNDATIAGSNQNFLIGGGYNNGLGTTRPFDGKIAEIIIYTGVPSPLEQEKIQSYLAIKYGITKNSADVAATAGQDERDYFASNGAVIWQYAANAAFNNNVTGIGLDNTSLLDQQKSLSANAGADVTLTGSISNNLSFIVWGDNNAANGTSSDTPGGYAKRINKVFKTNVTGAPGLVNFSIDLTDLGLPTGLAPTDYALLIDGDGVFNSGASIHTTGAAIANGQLSFTNVPFADGNFFTVAVTTAALKGPANVTENLKLWLKANTGVTGTSPIISWADQSGNGFTATAAGNAPTLLSNQLNFNPTVDFNSTLTQYLQINNGIMGSSSYTNQWIYAVSKGDVLQNNTLFYEGLASGEYLDLLLPWGNLVYNDFGSTGAGRITGAWGGSINSYNVWTVGSSASAVAAPNGTNKIVSRDGNVILSNNTNDPTVAGNNQNFVIGGGYSTGNGATFNLDGKIAELIIFTGVPTPLEQEKIQSYLSLKYGLTKNSVDNVATAGQDEADYFASNGAVIWDYSANTIFHNNVTGIGRDNASQLNQPQSLSANAGADVTMTGTIATDLSFIVWGDNNAANGTSTDTPGGYAKRINKVFKTNVAGTPGLVNFSIDLTDLGLPIGLAATDYALLIDGDGVFNSGAAIHTTGASIANGQLSFTNVSLADGNFFTVAVTSSALKGPANVTDNLKLWLKANTGVTGTSPVSGWTDQSGNGYNASAPGLGPDLLTGQINFNPALDFTSASSQYMQVTNGIMGSSPYTNAWVYLVSKADIVQDQTLFYESLAGGETFNVLAPWGNANVYLDFGATGGSGRINGAWGGSVNNYNVWTLGSGATAAATPNGTNKIISRDGAVILSNNNNDATIAGNNQNFLIGGGYNNGLGTTRPFDGKIAEMIVFTTVPTPLEQEKIQSYLSLKYGLTKNSADVAGTAGQDEADYFASNGAVIWDYSVNTAYHNRVTGIGRDDASQLSQQKSSSPYTGSVLTIDKTTSFGSNLSYIVAGDDNGVLSSTSVGVPSPYTARTTRIWKTNVTGSPGAVSVSFDLSTGLHNSGNAADYALLIKNSNTAFNSGATIVTAGASIINNVLTFPNVTLTDGDFFTLGLAVSTPGGVAGSVFWVKGGSGVTGTSNVSLWADQSGTGNNAVQSNPANQPALVTNDINFNSSINFSGGTTIMSPVTPPADLNSTVFSVAVPLASASNNWRTMFRGAAGDHQIIIQNGGGTSLGYYDNDNSTNFQQSGLTWQPNEAAVVGLEMRTGDVNLRKNGTQGVSFNSIDLTGINLTYFGNYQGNNQQFGRIGETIIYNTASPLSATDKNKVESYLAVKYGITLTHDYISTGGSTIWNITTNSAYSNSITGIGRDDVTALDQRKSKSMVAGSVLTIEKSTPASAFGNNQNFLITGDDAATLSATTVGVAPGFPMRVSRIWRTQLTGTPGTVTITFDLGTGIYKSATATDYALLISNTPGFGSSTPITGGVLGANTITFSNVTLTDGSYFTLGLPFINSPGNVINNLKVWLRADLNVYSDAGTTPAVNGGAVSQWNDQTSLANNAAATATPLYNTSSNLINFNPTIYYDGTSGHNLTYSVSDQYTIFTMAKMEGTQNGRVWSSRNSNSLLGYWNGREDVLYLNGTPSILGGQVATTNPRMYTLSRASNGAYQFLKNGAILNTGTAGSSNNTTWQMGIANGGQYPAEKSKVYISEMIIYDRNLSTAEINSVQSYLAVKYGLTLDQSTPTNYVSADGTVIWDATSGPVGNASYRNNIAGIGRDDASKLNQLKSQSINTRAIVQIEKQGGSFASDKTFLMWGADDNTLSPTAVGTYPGYPYRLAKAWRVDQTGTTGLVSVSFDLGVGIFNTGNAADYGLAIKNSNADFSSGAAVNNSSSPLPPVFNGNVITFRNVTFADGDYFTLVLPNIPAPGGVVGNVQLWLKGNTGVTDAGGGVASSWTDQSGNGFNVTQSNNAARPAILNNQSNFNPTVKFDGADDQLTLTGGIMGTGTYNDFNAIIVSRAAAIASSTQLYETQASGGRINTHIPWNNGAIYWDAGDAGTNRLSGNWNGVLNTNYLWTLTSSVSGTASGAKQDIFRNGLRIYNDNTQNAFTGNNSTFYLGSQAGNYFTNGDISEVVLYTGNLTSNQLQRINSYMAIKYGLTLDQSTAQNYLSSTSATIYRATTTHLGYVYNVAGIGRDDNSALDQRKSQSQDTPLDIFTASNKDFTTPGTFDSNLQFLIWGNNGLATSSDASTPAVTHAGSSIVRRLARVWSTDRTGTPTGNLVIEMDLSLINGPSGPGTNAAAAVRLLLDDDATFGNGSAGEKIYSTSSVAGAKLYFTVPYSDIPSQSFMTVGSVNIATAPLFIPTPGGIAANMRLWLKGDNGATTSSWTDFSGNGFNATQANVANQPSILTNRVNFNPSVVFNGSNQNFAITNGVLRSVSYNDAHVFVISRTNTIQSSQLLFENTATSQFVTYIPWSNSNVYWDAGDNSANRLTGAWGGTINQSYLWSLTSSTSATPSGAKQDIYRNGLRFLTKSTMFNFSGNNSAFYLGSGPNSNYYNGEISEVAVIGSALTPSQFQRVQTYLAIKYGITLDQLSAQNYYASTDAIIYHTTTTHANYKNDIAGIGRDDNSALDQRKSKNINQIPDVIAVANGDFNTPTAFANSLEFLVWGHNGLPYSADAATASYTHNGAAIVRQLARIWSTDKTSSPSGNAVIEMDMSLIGGPGGVPGSNANADVRLLLDNDVTFGNASAGERAYAPDGGYSATGGKIYFTIPYAQIQAGQGFFTLGSVNLTTAPISIPYPGGVATNIKLWLKADAGTNSTVNGAAISSWADRSGNSFTATQASGGSQPIFTTGAINFNPGLTFNGSSHQMQITSGILGTGTYTDVNAYVIGTVATAPKNQSAFWENTAGSRLNVHTPEGNNLVWDPGSTTYRLSTNWGGTINTPYMWSFAASTTATQSGARTDIFRNALRIANANTMASFVGNNSSTYIGSIGNNYYYGGIISEEVIYTGPLTSLQQSRVHSYLALKYGLTMDQTTAQDYLAANGTILYHATTTHNGYKTEIAGIGRDDDSGLDQRQSKSINANSIITMEKTTPASAFANNRDFAIWGDDGLSNAPTTIGAVNVTYPTRITKTWKVDTNGTPGTVTVSFNLNAGIYNSTVAANYALLIKNADNDFTTGATIHTTGASINAGVLTFTNVNFSDNDFFTLAMPRPPAPGGVVNNLKLWLKANAGVYSDAGVTPATNAGSVQQWTDQTQLGNNGTATGTPVFNTVANTINFNPTVYYDGASGHNVNYSVSGQYTIFTMSRLEGSLNRRVFNSRVSNYLIGYYNGRENVLFLNGTPSNLTGVAASTTPRLYAFSRANTGAYQMFNSGATLYSGAAGTSNDPIMQWSMGNGGQQSGESSRAFVSESIIYDRNLNAAELSAVQSYLAIKYGITIDQTSATNYVTADGTVTWNGTTNVSYKNDIAGIGRDDRSALDQRKSKSVNTNSALIIEKTSPFATDKDFMTWGSDASLLAPTSVGVHASYPYRVSKAWRVQLNGTPGVVNVSFDLNSGIYNSGNANDYALMIKNADANFSTGTVTLNNLSSSPAPTLAGGILTFYNVSFTNGDYFSLALPIVPAPGGVVNGMQLWVKANTGVTGSPVSSWSDQSGNGFNISQTTAANQPAYLSNDVNFNPSLQFDGVNDQLTQATGIIGTATYNNLHTFMVSRVNAVSMSSIFYETQSAGGRINAHVPWNDNIVYWDAGSTNGNQRLAIAWGGTVNTNYLWSMTASTTATPSGARQDIYRNGLRIANDPNMATFTGNNSTLYFGSNGTGNYYNGEVSENVIYTNTLNLSQFQRIQSYFAVKYGITLNQATPQSYYASDWTGSAGTLIWDATAAATYKNDIAAIGRDDYSALSQKQSASLNTGNILTIGNNAIAIDNATNANAFGADKSFFSWAHNGLNISTWTITDYGTTVNAQTMQGRIARVWFAKETGTVGSLKLRFDLSAVPGVGNVPGDNELANVRLLVDADGTFATGATAVNSTTFNNTTDIIEFDYDFGAATGFYFTLATTNMANAPLPIELVNFEAISTNKGAVVRWATESELNSDYFVVQVSQDGNNWSDVIKENGQGTKKSRTDYEILDSNPFVGRSYYRLKQVDLDGKTDYSKVVALDFIGGELHLYPNPAFGSFKLKTTDISGQLQSIRIMNLQGTEVIRKVFSSSSARMAEQEIDISSLAEAPYIVLIQTSTKSYQVKLIVTK